MLYITDQAKMQIEDMLNQEREKRTYLRFGTKGEVCSGLSYTLGFDKSMNANDLCVKINGLDVILSKNDVDLVQGSTIDFRQNMLGGEFVIDNPNTIKSCDYKTRD